MTAPHGRARISLSRIDSKNHYCSIGKNANVVVVISIARTLCVMRNVAADAPARASHGPAMARQWRAENPRADQCNVTALSVHELFGGELSTRLPEGTTATIGFLANDTTSLIVSSATRSPNPTCSQLAQKQSVARQDPNSRHSEWHSRHAGSPPERIPLVRGHEISWPRGEYSGWHNDLLDGPRIEACAWPAQSGLPARGSRPRDGGAGRSGKGEGCGGLLGSYLSTSVRSS